MDDLQFYEAPDYAALFEKEFTRLNQGYDDAETMESINDEQRVADAKRTPLKTLEGIATLTEKGLPLVEAEIERRQNNQQDAYNEKNYSKEARELNYAVYSKGKKVLLNDLQVNQRYAEKLKAEGRTIDASLLIDRSEWNKTRFGFLRARIDASKDNLIADFEEAHPNFKSYNASDARAALQGFLTPREKQFRKMPTVLYNDLKDHFSTFEDTLMSEKNKEVEAVRDTEKFQRDKGLIYYALTQTDPVKRKERLLDFVETNFIPQGGKRKDGWNYAIAHTLELLKTGQISPEQAHQIKEILLEHRGEQGKEKDVGSMYYKVFEANNFDGEVAAAADIYVQKEKKRIDQFSESERKRLLEMVKEQGGDLSEEQINAEIKNWDETKNGPIPDWLKNWATKTTAEPLNGPHRPPLHIQTQANTLIETMAKVHVESNPDLNDVNKEIIIQRGKDLYQYFYNIEMKDAISEDAASKDAMEQVEIQINKGLLNERLPVDKDAENKYKLNLKTAAEAIAANPDIVNTGIIYGSESVLEEVRENPSVVHPFYKQLSDQLSGTNKIPGFVLQYNQLAIANKQFGKEEPIKSKILQEFEALDDDVKWLLSIHPTPQKVKRALITQYQKDKEISFDVVEYLLEGIDEEDTAKVEAEKARNTPKIGEYKPHKGEWKKIKGTAGYVIYNGTKWVYQVGPGKKDKEYIGSDIKYYSDFGGVVKEFKY